MGKLILLAWLLAWFGVIVPGHRRGAVLLPGPVPVALNATSTTDGARLAMSAATGCCPITGQRNNDPPAERSPTSHCAVCYLAAVIDLPTPLNLTAPPLGLLARLAPLPPEQVVTCDNDRPNAARAPPVPSTV